MNARKGLADLKGRSIRVESNNASMRGKPHVDIDLDSLPWDSLGFITQLILFAVRYFIAHSGGREITQDEFIAYCQPKAGKAEREADEFLAKMAEEDISWEYVESSISKTYHWKLASRDRSGLIEHFNRKIELVKSDL